MNAAETTVRPTRSLLTNPTLRSMAYQGVLCVAVGLLVYAAISNAADNLARARIATGFGFWNNTAGFDISQTLIEYSSRGSSYGRAFWVGLLNTLLVGGLGIVFATVLGFAIGIARLSSNWLVAKVATGYVELIRNLPLLLQLLFWYNAVLKTLPETRDRIAVAGFRQGLEHGVVPEQQLQQQRQIADQLDIAGRHLGHQPVARQPRDADRKAEHGGEYNAEAAHQQGIEQADPEGAAIARAARRIFDQRLADVEAGIGVPESEAGRDPRARQIVGGIGDGFVSDKADRYAQRHLIGDAAQRRISQKRSLGPGARCGGTHRFVQRIGGAYCRPPLLHSAFSPRLILSGEPCPTLRSNTSP